MWRENSQQTDEIRLSTVRTPIMEETAESELGSGNVPQYVLSIKYTLEGILMPSVGFIGLFGKYLLIIMIVKKNTTQIYLYVRL